MSNKNNIFRVIYMDNESVVEIYAKSVIEADLVGFLMVEEFLFGEKSSIVVDPSEEQLKNEFSGVVRTFIPYHSVIRIDEVEKQGSAKISPLDKGAGNVSHFPAQLYSKPVNRQGKDD